MKNPEAAELGEETGKSLPVIVWKALEDYLSRQKSETRDTTGSGSHACAVKWEATHIITYNPHIKELGEDYRGIKIVEPVALLKEIRKQTK